MVNAQGIQEWTGTQVRRYSFCPEHASRSSDFLGVGEDGWLFRCKETEGHLGHTFVAKADPDAPRTPEEATRWLMLQKSRVAQ